MSRLKENIINERSVQHTTFVIERTYGVSPARVFAAWANPEAKAQWFPRADEFDFRVGGREFNRGLHEGATYTYDAHYQDIVPGQRIVYTSSLDRDETRISISVTTVSRKLPLAHGYSTRSRGPFSTAKTGQKIASMEQRSSWMLWARYSNANPSTFER
ncbi:MAG TPA: SRPBCC domain-containing protein [Ktedonosporobacter sp.]|nr:SRPBCC domain-containing protein [Ktedonosporobacter sp.]